MDLLTGHLLGNSIGKKGVIIVIFYLCYVRCVHMDRGNITTLGEKGDRILQWMKNNMLV